MDSVAHALVGAFTALTVAIVVLAGGVFLANYEGQRHLVESERNACVASIPARAGLVKVLYEQSLADTTRRALSADELALARTDAGHVDPEDAHLVPASLRQLATSSCSTTWPIPSALP